MTILLYIVTAFVCGFYLGSCAMEAHIKREFRKIDKEIEKEKASWNNNSR